MCIHAYAHPRVRRIESTAIQASALELTQLVQATWRRADASVGGVRGRGRLVVAASQVITGVVVSTKMDKTAVVEVARKTAHPKYKKVVRRTKKYLAHDEENECKEGYLVTVEPVGRKCGFLPPLLFPPR